MVAPDKLVTQLAKRRKAEESPATATPAASQNEAVVKSCPTSTTLLAPKKQQALISQYITRKPEAMIDLPSEVTSETRLMGSKPPLFSTPAGSVSTRRRSKSGGSSRMPSTTTNVRDIQYEMSGDGTLIKRNALLDSPTVYHVSSKRQSKTSGIPRKAKHYSKGGI